MSDQQIQQLIHAVQQLDVPTARQLLDLGLDPNTMDESTGPLVSIVTDKLYDWWCVLLENYENNIDMSEADKLILLKPYQEMLQLLIDKGASLHMWDAEENYGPLWDAASAACVPVVKLLLEHKVNPNRCDDEGLSVLSSISHLFYDCDYDMIDWSMALPEEKQTLALLREHGALTTAEMTRVH